MDINDYKETFTFDSVQINKLQNLLMNDISDIQEGYLNLGKDVNYNLKVEALSTEIMLCKRLLIMLSENEPEGRKKQIIDKHLSYLPL